MIISRNNFVMSKLPLIVVKVDVEICSLSSSFPFLSHIWRKKAISYDFQNTILIAKHVSENLIGLCISSINMDSQYIIERILDGPLIKKKVLLSEVMNRKRHDRLNVYHVVSGEDIKGFRMYVSID